MCSGTPRCPVKIPGKLEKSPGNTWNIPGKWKSKFAGHSAILPAGEFYPSIFKSPSLFSSGKEYTDTASSSGL